jgi:THUMP domain-like
VPAVGIKAAPGLQRGQVPDGWETEFVAVGRDLKEALLWSPALAGASSRATILPEGVTLAPSDPGPIPLAEPGAFLFDPSPAVTRAGLVAELAVQLDAWQIDPMIAFLSAGQPKSTPFARTLRVLESAPWHEKRFAARLRELGIGTADIRRRGLAGDVVQIHRRLGLRGPGAATIVLTRVANRPWGLICTPV